LWFDVVNSASLSPKDKELIMSCLPSRIGRDGFLQVISQQTRSQGANRELAIERFVELLRDAEKQLPIRKKIRVSRAAKLRRMEEKKQHSIQKQQRLKKSPSRIWQKETPPVGSAELE
jgi:ribosome-associated protein